MARYKVVDVTEAELEDLVRNEPELIEEGMRFVDHQVATDRGRLDVLLVNSGNVLVVAELKVVQDDGMLMQGLDYYDYVFTNLAGLAGSYDSSAPKIDPSQQPRLLLIAQRFSDTLLRRLKWLDVRIPISLFTFRCVELDERKGEKLPIYSEVTPPPFPHRPETPPSLDQHFDYIADPDVRNIARSLIEIVQSFDPTRVVPEPTVSYVSVKVSSSVLAYIRPRKNFLVVETGDPWTGQRIENEDDLDRLVPVLRETLERWYGGSIPDLGD